MLDFMRKQRQSLRWLWIVIIVVFTVPLLTYFINWGDLGTGAMPLTGDIAKVGSESISVREFQDQFNSYYDRVRGQITPEVIRALGIHRQVLDPLIMQRVVISEAKRLGLSVSDEEIERNILENPVFRDTQSRFIGIEQYRNILSAQGLTVEQFENSIRSELLLGKLRALVTAAVGVGDTEVEEEYRNRNEKATLDYFVIEPARLESQVAVNDQEARDHYEKNKAIYNVPEKRQAKYLFFNSALLGANEKPTEAEMREYYDQHPNDFRTAETVTAQHILFRANANTPQAEIDQIQELARSVMERAKKGEDFAALAREFSQDTTAALGGNLGGIRRGEMVPEFEKAVFALNPGGISDVVRTQYGFHIIKVNDKQNDRVKSFEEVKDTLILPTLKREKGQKRAADLAQQAASEALRTKDLNAVAQKIGGEVKETPLLERGDSVPGLGPNPEFTNQLFTLRDKGDSGTAIATPAGYVVMMLTDKQDPHPATFEEVKDRVTGDVRSEKAKELATQKGNQAQEQIKAGKDLRTVAKALGMDVKTSQPITRGAGLPEFGSITDLEKEIFSLPIGKAGTPATSAGKTLAYAVKERTRIDPAEVKKSMDSIRGDLLNRKREEYFVAYTQEARKRMEDANEITIDEKALDQIANIG